MEDKNCNTTIYYKKLDLKMEELENEQRKLFLGFKKSEDKNKENLWKPN